MKHFFDVGTATRYGVNCAILLQSIYYWVKHNEANGAHFYNDRFWTFNSKRAFEELFPYMGEKQIRNAINTLESEGLVLVGHFSYDARNRTKWYTLTEKGLAECEGFAKDYPENTTDSEPAKRQKGQIALGETPEQFGRNARTFSLGETPEPYINRYSNTDIVTTDIDENILNSKEFNRPTCSKSDKALIVEAWNSLPDVIHKIRVETLSGTSKRFTNLKARLSQYGLETVLDAISKIKESPFLLGEKTDFKITFDWFVKPTNFSKVLDGNYVEEKRASYIGYGDSDSKDNYWQ